MRLQILRVIRLTRLCLVNTTVITGPLLRSLRRLPKTLLITSSGMELIALARPVKIHVQGTMAHKYINRRRMTKGDRVWVCHQPKNLGDKICAYWADYLYVFEVDQQTR